jgi:uncharacterized membrane protein
MPEITETIVINRPVSEVFRFVADLNKTQEWQPDVEETHATDERARVGVMVTQPRSSRMLGWRLDLNADIVEYTPNRLIEYKGVLGRFPVKDRLEFESSGGTTTVRETVNVRMGILFALFSPFMRSTLSRRTRRALEGLKTRLENRTSSTSATDFHKQL